MLQLENMSGLEAAINTFPNVEGIETLFVVVKATFSLEMEPRLLDEQRPIQLTDEYWAEPNESSVKYASEVHPSKLNSDVILIGQACAPDGAPVSELDVRLAVGRVEQRVRVFGDRVWERGRPSAPKPFVSMPLRFERAYGGVQTVTTQAASDSLFERGAGRLLGNSRFFQTHIASGEVTEEVVACEQNPLGVGFTAGQLRTDAEGLPLPNLEDPNQLIASMDDRPQPVGFGAVAAAWQPRLSYVGTYDEVWQQTRAPYLPADFDARFFNVAHPKLIYPGFLQGGETLELINLRREGPLALTLPQLSPSVRIDLDNQHHQAAFNLETLLIDTEADCFSLTWRAEMPVDKSLPKVKTVRVECEDASCYRRVL